LALLVDSVDANFPCLDKKVYNLQLALVASTDKGVPSRNSIFILLVCASSPEKKTRPLRLDVEVCTASGKISHDFEISSTGCPSQGGAIARKDFPSDIHPSIEVCSIFNQQLDHCFMTPLVLRVQAQSTHHISHALRHPTEEAFHLIQLAIFRSINELLMS
jgi:hypothetical protein